MKEDKRGNNHSQGRAISLMEMIHMMIKYPEVYTDLTLISIPTIPLEI